MKGADSRGSGLGLAIARGLVEAHGGDDRGRVAPGEGTTFRVPLPRLRAGDPHVVHGGLDRAAAPRSAASKTIRTFSPAHGASGTLDDVQAGLSLFAAPTSWRTSVRLPSSRSTYARK